MSSISTAHRNAIESARQRQLRSQVNERIQDEIRWAKQIRQETGCTWTEAIRIAYNTKGN